MTETSQKTVGEIVAGNPAAARLFEKFQIDFCCHGKRAFDEVCAERGLDPGTVAAELAAYLDQAPPPERDWTAAPLDQLIAHINSRHHEYLKAELPRLESVVARVEENHRDRRPWVVDLARAFRGLRVEIEGHLQKEEMILFPFVLRMEQAGSAGAAAPEGCFGHLRNPISVMEMEHENAGRALATMRRLTSDYAVPEDVCNGFRVLMHGLEELEADLHMHIHLENNILFPRALKL